MAWAARQKQQYAAAISACLAFTLPAVFASLSLAIPPRARSVGFAMASVFVLAGLITLPVVAAMHRLRRTLWRVLLGAFAATAVMTLFLAATIARPLGRLTEVATPVAIGLLVAPLGIPGAIAVVAAGPILGAALVLRFAPETRGLTLEEVQEHLAGGVARR